MCLDLVQYTMYTILYYTCYSFTVKPSKARMKSNNHTNLEEAGYTLEKYLNTPISRGGTALSDAFREYHFAWGNSLSKEASITNFNYAGVGR